MQDKLADAIRGNRKGGGRQLGAAIGVGKTVALEMRRKLKFKPTSAKVTPKVTPKKGERAAWCSDADYADGKRYVEHDES